MAVIWDPTPEEREAVARALEVERAMGLTASTPIISEADRRLLTALDEPPSMARCVVRAVSLLAVGVGLLGLLYLFCFAMFV